MRFASIGLGKASVLYHLPALKRIEGAEVVGGFDIDGRSRSEWHRSTGVPVYDSFDALVEHARPDAIIVATPPTAHREPCVRAIEAGCHLFCEKPFVESTRDADEILDAARRRGRVVAVNHEFRENPIFRAVREQVDAGRHGRLVFCQVWQLMNLAPWDEPTPWRAGMASRTLLEGGVHLVDLLLSIFRVSPTAVYARSSAGFHHEQSADAIQLVTLEFPGGLLGQITIDRLCPAGTRYMELRADCERTSLRASFGGRATLQLGVKRAEHAGARVDFGLGGLAWSERGQQRRVLARNPRDGAVVGTARLLHGFIRAVENGNEPPSSGREAREVIAVIEAAYESARTSSRVELAPLAAPA